MDCIKMGELLLGIKRLPTRERATTMQNLLRYGEEHELLVQTMHFPVDPGCRKIFCMD